MWAREQIVEAILESGPFIGERKYVERGGYTVSREPRLFKVLHDNNLVRVVFPTDCSVVSEGAVVCITTLFDMAKGENIYGHIICAGPGVNTLLKAKDNPMPPAPPQAPPNGEREVRRFVAWKEASWVKFLNDELDLGTDVAGQLWMANFWKALDRMFGYGYLVNYDPDAVIAEAMKQVAIGR